MDIKFEAFQFLSRSLPPCEIGRFTSNPKERPDVRWEFRLAIEVRPLCLAFAQLFPQRPSAGAFQYVDPDEDKYLSHRWPTCVSARGHLVLPERESELTPKLRKQILGYGRTLLWDAPCGVGGGLIPPDQRASVIGYRREFEQWQMFDLSGQRIPSTQGTFAKTEVGEPTGPGVVTLPDLTGVRELNELVWSPILAFPTRTDMTTDKDAVVRELAALKKHYNSYNELIDARRYVDEGDVKAAVRAGASVADALLRYGRERWAVGSIPGTLPFDDKIEYLLTAACKPSYRSLSPQNSEQLLFLYRARNSMHEGDCYYTNGVGRRINLRQVRQILPMIQAVEDFALWFDSLV